MMSRLTHPFRCLAIFAAVLATAFAACDRSPAPSAEVAPRSNVRAVSNYRSINGSEPVAVVDDAARASLDAAITEARRTADDARARWEAADGAARLRWLVKWAAPVRIDPSVEDSPSEVEHVWVLPINWSPFRIEGVLMSKPIAELECGKTCNDLVSFTADELSDWMVTSTSNSREPEQGGFTVKSLEKTSAQ